MFGVFRRFSTLRAIVLVVGVTTAMSGLASSAQSSPLGDLNARTPADPVYTVALTSDTNGFTWTGTESITFTNVVPRSLNGVWLRLWDNYSSCDVINAIQVS